MLEFRAIQNGINVIRGSEPEGGISVLRGARGERVTFGLILKSDRAGMAKLAVNAGGNKTRVYFETFVNVTEPTRYDFKKGEYADGLLELPRAEKLGLTDLEPNKTYAFLVAVDIPSDGKNFNVVASVTQNCRSETVTVEVKPYDFDMPTVNHSKTCYMIWRDCHRILGTQAEQDEKYAGLSEMLLDFRVSPYIIPYSWESVDRFIEKAKEYAADPRVGAYSITYRTKREKTIYDDNQEVIDVDYMRATLRAMVENSTDELNLFKKAYIHYTFIDEPTPATYHAVKRCHDETYDLIREVGETYDFTDKPEVERYLLNLCDIVTAWCNAKLYSNVDTYCAFFDADILPEFVYEAKKLASLGRKRWWYGCNAPKHPFPNHHTDSPLADSRIEPWMRFYRGIEGDLYWSVNYNYAYDEKTSKYVKDLVDDPHCWTDDNGEGLLIYTGTRYGDPFPTLRLNATCEGQKDYEYLTLLESLCRENQNYYETRFDVREMLSDLFMTMFDETCNLSSAARIEEGKDELAGRIELAEKGIFVFGSDGKAEVYAPVDSDVKIENARLVSSEKSGKGKKLTFALENLPEFTVVCGCGKNVKLFAAKSEPVDISSISVSDDEIYPPYAVNYWRNTGAKYLTAHRKINLDDVSVSDYRGGKLIETEPFLNVAPPVFGIDCAADFTDVTHVKFDLGLLSDDAFILQLNLFDENGNRYEAGYGVVEKDGELRVAVNRLMEKRLNALYDYVSIWKEENADRQKKVLEAFDFSAVKKLQIVLLNPVMLLDDNRERKTNGIAAVLRGVTLEKRNVTYM